MAKKIRFPLQMKDGAAVRTLEELWEHFDLESVLGYFADGKLKTWLSDRYYDEMAEKVATLTADVPDLNAKLCEILGVEYSSESDDTDFEALQRQNEKLRVLREVTDDQEILNNVDSVAFDQDELFDILDEAPDVIYLYGDKFSIPYAKGDIKYTGINNCKVVLENDRYLSEYNNNGIVFNNIRFEDGINPYAIKGEIEFLQGDLVSAFKHVEQFALNGNPRAMYLMACYYDQGYGVVEPDESIRNDWCSKAFNYHEPLSSYGYIKWCMTREVDKSSHYSKLFNEIENLSELGDVLAQGILAEMYRNGLGVTRNLEKSVALYTKAAEKGEARSQYSLGLMYKMGYGVERDMEFAIAWFKVAADKRYKSALQELMRFGISS